MVNTPYNLSTFLIPCNERQIYRAPMVQEGMLYWGVVTSRIYTSRKQQSDVNRNMNIHTEDQSDYINPLHYVQSSETQPVLMSPSEIDNDAYCVCTHDFSLCTH